MNDVLKQRNEKLAEAQKAQAEIIKKERELADAKREMDSTIEKRVTESVGKARESAQKEAEDKLGLQASIRFPRASTAATSSSASARPSASAAARSMGNQARQKLE